MRSVIPEFGQNFQQGQTFLVKCGIMHDTSVTKLRLSSPAMSFVQSFGQSDEESESVCGRVYLSPFPSLTQAYTPLLRSAFGASSNAENVIIINIHARCKRVQYGRRHVRQRSKLTTLCCT